MAYDGRYYYFIGASGQVIRYDPTLPFSITNTVNHAAACGVQ